MRNDHEAPQQPMLLTIPQVAKRLGLCRAKVYSLIVLPEGGLPVIRFGRSVRVSVTTLKKWIEERENEQRPV